MNVIRNIRYISFQKIVNLCRLQNTFRKAKQLSASTIPMPAFATFEPTNICNLHCRMCPSGNGELKRPSGYANFELFKKFIDENSRNLICLILHFQGEPLLNKQLGEMIGYAEKKNIYTMLSTNGQCLAENAEKICKSGLSHIIVSLDGLSNETYQKYRIGGDVNKVFEGLQKLAEIPKRPKIELQFLVFPYNEHEICKLKDLKKKYRIDKITLKSAQLYDISQAEFLTSDKKYSRYTIENGKLRIKNALKNECKRLIFGAVSTFDGKIVPCCFDKDADFTFGNISESSLNDIRNSEKYKDFCKKVFLERKSIDICTNCTEGLKI